MMSTGDIRTTGDIRSIGKIHIPNVFIAPKSKELHDILRKLDYDVYPCSVNGKIAYVVPIAYRHIYIYHSALNFIPFIVNKYEDKKLMKLYTI